MARYANWHSDQLESLMSVGSNPTRATRRQSALSVPWSNGNDSFLTKRKRGFDSLRDDSVNSGCWSNGKTPGLQPGDRGSTPRWSIQAHRLENGKVAGYGWPGRTANAVSLRGMRVRIPCLPLATHWTGRASVTGVTEFHPALISGAWHS